MAQMFDYGAATQPAVQAVAAMPHVILHDVNQNRVYPTKNPNMYLVSIGMAESENGYGNVIVDTGNLTKQENGFYDVDLGAQGRWMNVSMKKNGSYVDERKPLTEILALYETSKAMTASEPKQEQKTEEHVHLSYLSKRSVFDTKNPAYKVISFPYMESESGFAKLTIPTNAISPARDKSESVHVDLGAKSDNVSLSIQRNGSYIREHMTAQDATDKYAQSRAQYRQKQLDTLQGSPANEGATDLDTEGEMIFI